MSDKEEKCIFCYAEMPCEHDDTRIDKSGSDGIPDDGLSNPEESAGPESGEFSPDNLGGSETGSATTELLPKRPVGRPQKDVGDFEDPVSAGRKRAAVLAPIDVGLVCEWAFLRFAGGGPKPIKGCTGNPASDRHHGPDKSTLNNELEVNLHRICDFCHNRWHSANDEFYGERPVDNSTYLPLVEWSPHNSTEKMTVTEAHLEEIQRQ